MNGTHTAVAGIRSHYQPALERWWYQLVLHTG